MNDITSTIGLMRREFRDVHAVVSRLDASMATHHAAPSPSPRDLLARVIACHALGRSKGRPAAAVAAENYNNDAAVLKALAAPGMIGKAITGPALTSQVGWAIELVSAGNLDTLQLIAPQSVYAQLSSRPGSIRVDISGRGSIKIPTRAPTPNLAAPFVGEGLPIPVRQLALSAATITPKKAPVITMVTAEMLKRSTPSIEAVIRAAMEFDTSNAIDGVLLGATVVSAIAPPGLLNGVVATPATVGGGLAAFAGYVRALAVAIEATGAMADPVLIMSTTSAFLLSTLTQNTELPIITSPSVPAQQLIMLDAANFTSAEGDEPDFSSSNEVTLHQENALPQPIVGGVINPPILASVAAPVGNMYQVNGVAIRMLQDVTWGMTRTGRVAYVNATSW